MLRTSAFLLVAVALAPSVLFGQTAPANPVGTAVTVAGATQYDIPSRATRRTYRIRVAFPFGTSPDSTYPVLYVLDGNYYFGTAFETITRRLVSNEIKPVLLVTIGYPTDDWSEVRKARALDMTPSRSIDPKYPLESGQGDVFLKFIEDELKPFVRSHYKIDPARQVIWGHSFGGLIVVRALLRNPGAFSTYLISSPSLWWNKKEVLADTAQFVTKLRAAGRNIQVLVSSAELEQYRGTDLKLLADDTRMVDNASDFASWLGRSSPKIQVTRVVFAGEGHSSVSPASIGRAVGVAFGLPQ